jgi:hypothetical protein
LALFHIVASLLPIHSYGYFIRSLISKPAEWGYVGLLNLSSILISPEGDESVRSDTSIRNSYAQLNLHLVMSESIYDIRCPNMAWHFLKIGLCILILINDDICLLLVDLSARPHILEVIISIFGNRKCYL